MRSSPPFSRPHSTPCAPPRGALYREIGRLVSAAAPSRWLINDERDVQALLWTILAPLYGNDLVDEQYLIPSGQVQPRCDLGILSLKVIVEAKMLRAPADFRAVEEGIAADAGLYFRDLGRFDRMVVFLYDDSDRLQPERYATLAAAFETARTGRGRRDRAAPEHDPGSAVTQVTIAYRLWTPSEEQCVMSYNILFTMLRSFTQEGRAPLHPAIVRTSPPQLTRSPRGGHSAFAVAVPLVCARSVGPGSRTPAGLPRLAGRSAGR